jgi:hypothetical protein
VRLGDVDSNWSIVRLQVCFVEGDTVEDRPLLLGKAMVKKIRAGAKEINRADKQPVRDAHGDEEYEQEIEQKEVEAEIEDEGSMEEEEMVTISREEYEDLKRRAGDLQEAEDGLDGLDELDGNKALLGATEVDLKDVMYYLARSLETMAGIPGPRIATNNGAAERGDGDDDGELDPVVAAATGQIQSAMDQATRRVIYATRVLAETLGIPSQVQPPESCPSPSTTRIRVRGFEARLLN